MAGADRLSSLCDDLLAGIISFLPTREAVRTTALARRWRRPWLRTDTLNLDTRSYDHKDPPYGFYVKERLFSDACDALDAVGRRPVRKLSLFVKGRSADYCEDVMGTVTWRSARNGFSLMASLLADRGLRRIEELRVGFDFEARLGETPRSLFKLSPAKLPARRTLRVLDLACCRIKRRRSGAAVLPRLSMLRLYNCTSPARDLEELIRSIPSLRSLHIEGHNFSCCSNSDRFAVHCPELATLTLADRAGTPSLGIELDTPCLRAFKYSRPLTELSMRSRATKLARVDLNLKPMYYQDGRDHKPVELSFDTLWRFLGNFRHAKAIRLKMPKIECIAAVDRNNKDEHLVTFLDLQRLELIGTCDPRHRNVTSAAIADLLQCCPAIQHLRIRIVTDPRCDYQRFFVNARRKAPLSNFKCPWTCSRGGTQRRWFLSRSMRT